MLICLLKHSLPLVSAPASCQIHIPPPTIGGEGTPPSGLNLVFLLTLNGVNAALQPARDALWSRCLAARWFIVLCLFSNNYPRCCSWYSQQNASSFTLGCREYCIYGGGGRMCFEDARLWHLSSRVKALEMNEPLWILFSSPAFSHVIHLSSLSSSACTIKTLNVSSIDYYGSIPIERVAAITTPHPRSTALVPPEVWSYGSGSAPSSVSLIRLHVRVSSVGQRQCVSERIVRIYRLRIRARSKQHRCEGPSYQPDCQAFYFDFTRTTSRGGS